MNRNAVLYIDVICSDGHVAFNEIYISNLLKTGYEVKLILKKKCIKKLNLPDSLILFELPSFLFYDFKKYGIINRLMMLISFIYINFKIYKLKFSYVYVGGYEEISFYFSFFCKRTILINHNNIDGLNNRVKRYFFRKKSIKHKILVFNEKIKNYLIKIRINNLIVNSHGLPKVFSSSINNWKYDSFDKVIFLPSSSSSDLKFVLELINNSLFLDFLNTNNILLIIKGNYSIANPNIIVIDDFIDFEEYKSIFLKSDILLLPYPDSFRYRVSGVLHECLVNNKICLLSQIEAFESYSYHFTYNPFFRNIIELIERIEFLLKSDQFSTNHSYVFLDELEPHFNLKKI